MIHPISFSRERKKVFAFGPDPVLFIKLGIAIVVIQRKAFVQLKYTHGT